MSFGSSSPLYIYVDVDDTLVRSVGSTRIPITPVVEHIRTLKAEGAVLCCWSSGGGEYARLSAVAFLPKPHIVLDDQQLAFWRGLKHFHPLGCQSRTLEDYRKEVQG